MGLPLMTVRFDALFSRFLGATAVQLRAIFAEMPRRPGVYLFDEFDSVAKARGDSQDVGRDEPRRHCVFAARRRRREREHPGRCDESRRAARTAPCSDGST